MSYGFYLDMTSCTGCRTCQIACKDKNDLAIGTLFRRVETYESGIFPKPGLYHVSRTCNHCTNPACVENCPTGAMYIDEETKTVQHKDEECIGCQSCVKACPYGIPQFLEEDKIVHKCDMCMNLISQGENPACVDACMMRALEWGDFDEIETKHNDAVRDMAILPPSSKTDPHTLYSLRESATSSVFALKAI